MRQGLDIADAETATKIRAKYLRALENEEFDLLHGSTFVRSFLRTYGDYLGIDSRRLIDEYRARYEPRDAGEMHPIVSRPQREHERRGGPPGRGTAIVALAVALLAFLLILGLTGEDEGDPTSAGTGTATQPEERSETGERRRTQTTPRRRRRRTPTRVTLRISPREATYVCLDRGPGTDVLFEGSLEQARTFRGRRLRLNLGKTSASVRVNGRTVSIEPSPDPVGFDFTPRRRRALPEESRPCV